MRNYEGSPFEIPAGFEWDYETLQGLLGSADFDPAASQEAIRLMGSMVSRLPDEHSSFKSALLDAMGWECVVRLPGDPVLRIRRALQLYDEALKLRHPDRAPLEYAETKFHAGTAYLRLRAGNRAENLQSAIECFNEALKFFSPETARQEYGEVEHNLGVAYREMPIGHRAENLKSAIEHYEKALEVRKADTAPLDFAATITNLGNAYRELMTGDRATNLHRAIACYRAALEVRTFEKDPIGYAKTQTALGVTYALLPVGDRSKNLDLAIECYTNAINARSSGTDPMDYAETLWNLGMAYTELPRKQGHHARRGIECFTEALSVLTPDASPLDYANVKISLGIAWSDYPDGDRTSNERNAIASFEDALSVLNPVQAPMDFARASANFGAAYANMQTGNRAANKKLAIARYSDALRIFTFDRAPHNHRLISSNLGNLYFTQAHWSNAHDAYASAMAAGDLLYEATATEAGRRAELGQAKEIVVNDAYCLARLGRLDEAIERLEGGRTRALAEALARDRAALTEASQPDRKAFEAARDRVKALEAESRAGSHPQLQGARLPASGRSFLDLSSDLARTRAELSGVIERIRSYVPGFMPGGLTYREIVAASSPARPLSYLLATSQGSLALIVRPGSELPTPDCAVWLDRFTTETLDGLLVERDEAGKARGGYLVGQVTGNIQILERALERTLPILQKELLWPLAERLRKLGATEATLIPVGLLSLLPLPAACRENLTISLAPSARALHSARDAARDRVGLPQALLAVGNPLPPPEGQRPLVYAWQEVKAIAPLFSEGFRRILPQPKATREHVVENLPGATHIHLACHGAFNVDEPLDSVVFLAGGDRLTLRDLLDGHLDLSSTHLGVLSACQSGIIEFDRVPDEAIGLPAGFLLAGLPGVVATLWPVNDLSTAVLVAEFYRLLLVEGLNPAAALHGAQVHLRESTAIELDLAAWVERGYADSGESDTRMLKDAEYYRSHPSDRTFADPVYWAGFVYMGA
jgi:CHAT domain-containing protein